MHQMHYLKLQIEECQQAQDEKAKLLKGRIDHLSTLQNKKDEEIDFIELFESLSQERQDEILDRVEDKRKKQE